jgi:hypothetical protein
MKTYTFATSGGIVTAQGFTRDDARNRLRAAFPHLSIVPDDDRSEAQRLIDEEIREDKARARTEGAEFDYYEPDPNELPF